MIRRKLEEAQQNDMISGLEKNEAFPTPAQTLPSPPQSASGLLLAKAEKKGTEKT